MPRGRKKKNPEVLEAEITCEGMANPYGDKVCNFGKGDRVYITNGPEDAPDNFVGQVLYAKWSNISGWWLDVKREDNDRTYNVPVEMARAIDAVETV